MLNDTPPPGKFEANKSLSIAKELYDKICNLDFDSDLGNTATNGIYFTLIRGYYGSPTYITEEDDQGFFIYHTFNSDVEADRAWESQKERLSLWGQVDEQEYCPDCDQKLKDDEDCNCGYCPHDEDNDEE